MALLELKGVTMRFGGLTAVNGVSFAVEKGQVFSVIGPNGAGKTTVFNAVTGVYEPTEGDVLFEGKTLRRPFRPRVAVDRGRGADTKQDRARKQPGERLKDQRGEQPGDETTSTRCQTANCCEGCRDHNDNCQKLTHTCRPATHQTNTSYDANCGPTSGRAQAAKRGATSWPLLAIMSSSSRRSTFAIRSSGVVP